MEQANIWMAMNPTWKILKIKSISRTAIGTTQVKGTELTVFQNVIISSEKQKHKPQAVGPDSWVNFSLSNVQRKFNSQQVSKCHQCQPQLFSFNFFKLSLALISLYLSYQILERQRSKHESCLFTGEPEMRWQIRKLFTHFFTRAFFHKSDDIFWWPHF